MGLIQRINANPKIIFTATVIGFIGGILTIWDILIKPILNKIHTMNLQYIQDHWASLLGLTLIGVSLITRSYVRKQGESEIKLMQNEIASIKETIDLADKKDMDDEVIHAVVFWVNALNKTEKERNEYIRHYFPRNEKKIQEYFQKHYQGVGVGVRN